MPSRTSAGSMPPRATSHCVKQRAGSGERLARRPGKHPGRNRELAARCDEPEALRHPVHLSVGAERHVLPHELARVLGDSAPHPIEVARDALEEHRSGEAIE